MKCDKFIFYVDGAENEEVEVRFSGGRSILVPMERNRKTSLDTILNPPVETNKARFTITKVYSQNFNGFSIIRLWATDPAKKLMAVNMNSHHLVSGNPGTGVWGPWEKCPPGLWVKAWQAKGTFELGITGKLIDFCDVLNFA